LAVSKTNNVNAEKRNKDGFITGGSILVKKRFVLCINPNECGFAVVVSVCKVLGLHYASCSFLLFVVFFGAFGRFIGLFATTLALPIIQIYGGFAD